MKSYVVGHIDFFNNELVLERIEANTWQEALAAHSKCEDMFDPMPDTLEDAKEAAFDQDAMIAVLEL